MCQTECPVCMLEFGENPRNTVTTECGHKFHYSCLFKWNQDNTSCPMCRKEFEEIEQPRVVPEAAERGDGINFLEEYQARDLVIPVEACGMTLSCQRCNERVEFCANGCGRIVCYCQGPQISRNITNRSPIQQQNTEFPTCLECWHSRYETVLDYLDQRMTNSDLLTDEIYETEMMEEFYEMFFNNTNGNYIDEDGYETLQNSTFTDYDDFQDHIRETHRRHIYRAEGLEDYDEDAAETVAILDTEAEEAAEAEAAEEAEAVAAEEPEPDSIIDINDKREDGVDIDNLFSVFGIESEEESETDLDEVEEIEEVGEVEANEWSFEGKKYLVDDDNDVMTLKGIMVGKRIIVDGKYSIQPV